MFDRKIYYSYIKILETTTTILFMLYIVVLGLIGAFILDAKGLIIGFIVAVITAFPVYIFNKIKVEEMKWKLDIYNIINKKESL